MNKHLFLILASLTVVAGSIHAQDDDGSTNVLSYYAAVNSLDGQPMIDMLNVLRFYPVFALRMEIDSVTIVVYRGPSVIRRNAVRIDERRYWEVALPAFRLGEAIQRLEVEVSLKYSKLAAIVNGRNSEEVKKRVLNLAYSDTQAVYQLKQATPTIGSINADNIATSPIEESDISIDLRADLVKIQYRNYKSTLRRMPALDPAERLGVFRPRYVPFAVVGGRIRGPFANGSHPAVGIFEIGFGFGDIAVPGDEFVAPEISIRRLGIAFVISERLFRADAEILALAFTYDINTYGSIGFGANFAPLDGVRKPSTYFSLGINRRAFEGVAGQLQKLFR
jgi:hypothetical protein